MTLTKFCVLALGLLLLGEAGLAFWRYAPVPPSTDPIFSYPEGVANFGKGENIADAIKGYQADRGSGIILKPAAGTQLRLYYLEWDRYQVAPLMTVIGHAPEVCNVANGLKLEEVGSPRTYQRGSHPPLLFDSTRFTDRGGQPLFVFKMVFIQGVGSMDIRQRTGFRLGRGTRAFIRHLGQARTLQVFITGPATTDDAWKLFERAVLDTLEWR